MLEADELQAAFHELRQEAGQDPAEDQDQDRADERGKESEEIGECFRRRYQDSVAPVPDRLVHVVPHGLRCLRWQATL
jgi:hypothetical protein